MPETDLLPVPAHAGAFPPCFLPREVALPDCGALPLSGLTVLLVEDSRFASDAMRLMCHRSGARLRRAESIEQARAHLKTYRPDVVIIDLGLPDGRGDDLIREISLARRRSVVLGTSGDPDGRQTALAAGALGFLEKPVAGLAGFQRAVLRHLPDRFAIVADGGAGDRVLADPLALQDDLAHAAGLMAAGPDPGQRRYLAGFIGGLARVAGDRDLANAARAMEKGVGAMVPMQQMVRARLAEGRGL